MYLGLSVIISRLEVVLRIREYIYIYIYIYRQKRRIKTLLRQLVIKAVRSMQY